MDFDWADETIHATYGKHWHEVLYKLYPEKIPNIESLRQRCDELVAAEIAAATQEERADIRNALSMAQTANMHRDTKKHPEPFELADFLPFSEKPEKDEEVVSEPPGLRQHLLGITK